MAHRNPSPFSRILKRCIGIDNRKHSRCDVPGAKRSLRVEQLEARRVFAGLVLDSLILANSDTAGAYSSATAADAAGNIFMSGMFSGVMDFDRNSSHLGNPDILTARGKFDGFVAKYSSAGQLLWATRMGGAETDGFYDQVQAMAVDNSGNVYLGGQFALDADFGVTTLNSAGKTDAFVAKLDGNGNFLWANGWGSDVAEYVGDLVIDPNGTVTAVGSTVPLGMREIHIRQFDANGSAIWIGQFDGGGSASAGSITRDLDGNLYVSGIFKGTVDLDPGSDALWVTGSATTSNGFVIKLSGGGALQWATPLTADTSQYTNSFITSGSLAISDDGSVAYLGIYQGQVSIDSMSGEYRLPDAPARASYFAKLSPTGQLLTATAYDDDYVLGDLVAFSGGFQAMVTFQGGFNPTPNISLSTASALDMDIAVLELTGDGAPVCAFQLGATGNNQGFNIVSDGAGGFLATGWIGSGTTVDYDPDPYRTYTVSNPAFADSFVLKLKPRIDTKFYVVDDGSQNRTYEYGASGVAVENYTVSSGNTAPRGAASTVVGDKLWVVDANKKVYVYNPSGGLLGSWTAGSLASTATVEGIATNGTDVWIVDAKQDKVFKYTGAASRLSGSQNAVSSFSLNSGNTSPKDIVTDGTSIWVVNDSSTDKVFKYNLAGTLLGSWTISTSGVGAPTGITIDPSNPSHLWIVDSGTARVYQYDTAVGRTSGSLAASTSFALAAGNTNPQGIADPPPTGSPANSTRRPAVQSASLMAPPFDGNPTNIKDRPIAEGAPRKSQIGFETTANPFYLQSAENSRKDQLPRPHASVSATPSKTTVPGGSDEAFFVAKLFDAVDEALFRMMFV